MPWPVPRPALSASWVTTVIAMAAVATLAACGERDDARSVGEQVDTTLERGREVARDVREGGTDAAQDARSAVMGAASQAREATGRAGAQIDDAQVTTRVKAVLAADRELYGTRIDVETAQGTVVLSGQVPTLAAKTRAGELAGQVKEAQQVRNEITVAAR